MIGKQSSSASVFENSIEKGAGKNFYFYLSKRQWSLLAENGCIMSIGMSPCRPYEGVPTPPHYKIALHSPN